MTERPAPDVAGQSQKCLPFAPAAFNRDANLRLNVPDQCATKTIVCAQGLIDADQIIEKVRFLHNGISDMLEMMLFPA